MILCWLMVVVCETWVQFWLDGSAISSELSTLSAPASSEQMLRHVFAQDVLIPLCRNLCSVKHHKGTVIEGFYPATTDHAQRLLHRHRHRPDTDTHAPRPALCHCRRQIHHRE